MSVRLLDVNVLISLMDSAHVHHQAAVGWFRGTAATSGWATCPITEMGFVRILSGFSYPNLRLTPSRAGELLRKFQAGFPRGYEFWPNSVSLTDASTLDLTAIIGSRQVTDACLAAIAFRNGGVLSTFDGGVCWRAVWGASAGLVERIDP
jgi:toxin-antitoxin system PIN domain toxin